MENGKPQLAANLKRRREAKGWSQTELAQRAGVTNDVVSNTERGISTPRGDALLRLARALNCPAEALQGTNGDAPAPQAAVAPVSPAVTPPAVPQLIPAAELPRDLPVYGTAAASSVEGGAFTIDADPIDYVRRPPALMGAKDAYGLYVEGVSMEPKHRDRDLVFVHPHRRYGPGDSVVLYRQTYDDGEPESFIKEYVKRTAQAIVCLQYNPREQRELRRITAIHKILTLNDLFGV